jgi:hypothetical protein
VSFPLIILLAWLSIALGVIIAGFVITSNREPSRYVTLKAAADERSTDDAAEVDRKAA